MDLSARVLWREGMHLAQHHFQAQSRYFEHSIAFALTHLFHRPYGVAACEFDVEALRNGTIGLVHARGIMPDGLPFHFPEADPLPAPRDVRPLLSPTRDTHLVHLAIPPYRQGQGNCALDPDANGRDLRYVASTELTPDETTGTDPKPVSVARKNFGLLLDVELREGLVVLPVARVRRDGAGHLVFDTEFIPPLLQIGASEPLMHLLQRLAEMLEAKSDALSGTGKGGGKAAGAKSRDVASFWMAHSIQTSLAGLRHHLAARRSRPEELFLELGRLAGALCTFALESHPRTLPAYDHDHLEECFGALDRHIRAHLDVAVATHAIAIPLDRPRKFLHTGKLADRRCLGPSQWILGVRPGKAAIKATQLVSAVPQLMKICSAQHIARLVKEAFPGMPLEHLPVPPAGIVPQGDTQYFRLGLSGPCWESLVETAEVGIYVPESLAAAEVELHVVLAAESRAGR